MLYFRESDDILNRCFRDKEILERFALDGSSGELNRFNELHFINKLQSAARHFFKRNSKARLSERAYYSTALG